MTGVRRAEALKTVHRIDADRTRYAKAHFGQRWIDHHDDLLTAVVLLGETLGVDWEDG